jgi:hypothetical protein
MKIGIFGDSFADENRMSGKSWIENLRDNNDVTSFGVGGTSLEWSYDKFLNNHNDYEVIIFLATEARRMHMWDYRTNKELLYHINSDNSKNEIIFKNKQQRGWKFKLDRYDDIIFKGLDALFLKYMNTFSWKSTAIADSVKYKRPDSIIVQYDLLMNLQRLDYKNLNIDFNPRLENNNRPCHLSLKQNEEFANYILQENFLNTLTDAEKYYTISETKKEAGIKWKE